MRRAAKVDANQTEIIAALRQSGAAVVSLAFAGQGIPDLLVSFKGLTLLMEIKSAKGTCPISPTVR